MLPSIVDDRGDTEGLGVVLVEANACETPVIASRVGGIVDVVEDGFNGLLVKEKDTTQLANAILKLVQDRDLAKLMGENGRAKMEREFSWKGIAKRMEQAYFQVLEA